MAMLSDDVYEAFRSAGADEAKARKAAEALAQDQGRFSEVESKLDLHSWMIGAVVAVQVAILVRLFAGWRARWSRASR